ncbi:MAG: hypothetical protein L3K07_04240, partial [Thermoplasmata archaeon]|nr:hypothetical protein [Thermoplasmata archaeon]
SVAPYGASCMILFGGFAASSYDPTVGSYFNDTWTLGSGCSGGTGSGAGNGNSTGNNTGSGSGSGGGASGNGSGQVAGGSGGTNEGGAGSSTGTGAGSGAGTDPSTPSSRAAPNRPIASAPGSNGGASGAPPMIWSFLLLGAGAAIGVLGTRRRRTRV